MDGQTDKVSFKLDVQITSEKQKETIHLFKIYVLIFIFQKHHRQTNGPSNIYTGCSLVQTIVNPKIQAVTDGRTVKVNYRETSLLKIFQNLLTHIKVNYRVCKMLIVISKINKNNLNHGFLNQCYRLVVSEIGLQNSRFIIFMKIK